ncbi:hypothetical protein RBU61_00905 [Tissierella sp. MB52-C2]|uniref:hypothetical protein n=1 Tax=Tissierella sp. MB52-C2 TaxID=3070999 RepID=UPI00280B6801|nr:hypothetical protein [Tissierella sp. MB52-C2]WMM25250.1 hypothetical protein RBU61_00905 [Tissierella sp. MB52-C2]
MVGFNKLFNTEYNSLNDLDKSMINQLSEVYETYDNNSRDIWMEGYNFNNIPFILTPVSKDRGTLHAYSYVVGVDKLENSIFSKEMNLPSIYRVSFLSPSLIKAWTPAKFIFSDIGTQHVTFFKYNPLNTTALNTEKSFKYFLMHEVFHEYRQVPLWKNVNDLTSSIFIEERNKEQYQLLLLEFAIMDKANEINNRDELINILSDFVTAREYHYNKFQYMKQEKLVETLEGYAQYIEYNYSNLVGDLVKPPFTVDGEVVGFKDVFAKETLENFVKENSLNQFMDKNLYYYVGSLEGVLLDKLDINWKDRVENNELIYDIMKDEIYKRADGKINSIEEIKDKYGYDNFEDEAKIIIDNLD